MLGGLLCLLVLTRSHGSFGADIYNETSEQTIASNTAPSLTTQSLPRENASQEGLQGESTAATAGPHLKKSKAAEFRILYATNRTADFAKRSRTTKQTAAVYRPLSSSQDNKDYNAFREKSPSNKSPDQAYNRRSSTKPSFETARPRNWCAYVHTRLSPTVVIDSVASFFPIGTDPCYWKQDGCPERYREPRRPIYRMRHTIVTSLQWKCCPGYLGPQCQLSSEMPTQPEQADEAGGQSLDSHVEETPQRDRKTPTPIKEVKADSEKILTLEKQMTRMITEMDGVKKSLFSSHGKMKPDEKQNAPWITMETLKSKAIQEMFKAIAQEQIQTSQSKIEENIANVFQTISSLSQDLTATKENLKQINGAITKLLSAQMIGEKKNKQMANDIKSITDQVSLIQHNAVIHAKETTELADKYASLEDQLHLDKQNRISFFNNMNYTLSQMKEIQGDSLINESAVSESQFNNKTWIQHASFLVDVVRNQTLQIVQLQQELQTQEMRIENLTSVVGQHERLYDTTFKTLTVQCKQEMLSLLEEVDSHISMVNQTLSDRLKPTDAAVNAIEERISHMSNDLEELTLPTRKQNLSGAVQNDENDVMPIKNQLEDLTAAVEALNISVTYLAKVQDELSKQSQEKEEDAREKLRSCQRGIEDSVNDTMTVINNAIDSVKDDYYILQRNIENTNNRLNKISDNFTEKFQSLLNLKVDIDAFNTSVLLMQIKMEKSDVASNLSNMFLYPALKSDESNKPENLTHLSHKLNDVFSKLENHQRAISHLQQANFSIEFGECRMRLNSLELMINALSTNITPAVKPKKKPLLESGLAWKCKELSKQVQDLATKTLNLSHEVLRLKGSTSQAWLTCKNVSTTMDLMYIYIPQILQKHINLTLLDHGLNKFLHPDKKELNQSALGSNPTACLTSTLTNILLNITELQRHAQELDRRMEALYVTNSTVSVGRNQRDTDSISQEEDTGCHSGRCQNGGTCIEVRVGSVCACRFPFSGTDCTVKLVDGEVLAPDFSKGSYRYAPMVTFFAAHTYAMNSPGPIRFNQLYVNYGTSFSPGSGKFSIPYLGVYVFKYTIESSGPNLSGYLVVDEEDKLSFRGQYSSEGTSVTTGDAVLELNLGQMVWLRLETGGIPGKYPPVTTFGGYLLYRT